MQTLTRARGHRSPFGHWIESGAERQAKAERSQEAVRYHEAGHALVAAALGFEDVRIDFDPEPQKDISAITYYSNPHADAHRSDGWRKRQLAVIHAGALAEELRFGTTVINSYEGDGDGAAKLVSEGISRRSETPSEERAEELRKEQHRQARDKAGGLLTTYWGDVEWIARAAETFPMLGVHAIRDNREIHFMVHALRAEAMPSELCAA